MLTKITEENFNQIDPQMLLDTKWYQDMEDMVISIGAANTPDYAREYAKMFAEKLDTVGDQMDPGLFSKYLGLLKALKLFGISDLSDQQKEKLLSEDVLEILQLGFVDVQAWIDSMFSAYHAAPDIIDQIKAALLKGLENNLERLGSGNIESKAEGRGISPTIQNWLVDYRSFSQAQPGKTVRGTLEEVSYINQAPNPKILSTDDKQVLQRVLKLYDWLAFNEFNYDFSFPGQAIADDNAPIEGNAHELIPQELIDIINNVRAKKPAAPAQPATPKPVARPAAPPAPVAPRPKPMSDLDRKLAAAAKPSAPVQPSAPKPVAKPVAPAATTPPAPAPRPAQAEPLHPLILPEQKAEPKHGMDLEYLRQEFGSPGMPASTKPAQAASISNTQGIGVVDDLKKFDLAFLRKGPLQTQIVRIKNQIIELARANKLLPYYTVNAFEQSPLFKAYLEHGLAKVSGTDSKVDLSQEEFEAIADLKEQIEKL